MKTFKHANKVQRRLMDAHISTHLYLTPGVFHQHDSRNSVICALVDPQEFKCTMSLLNE